MRRFEDAAMRESFLETRRCMSGRITAVYRKREIIEITGVMRYTKAGEEINKDLLQV